MARFPAEAAIFSHTSPPERVVAASKNPARIEVLKWWFPNTCVLSVHGGSEENIDDSAEIARSKVGRAGRLIAKVPSLRSSNPPIIAGDTRTYVWTLDYTEGQNPDLSFSSQGKPSGTVEHVQRLFTTVAQVHDAHPQFPMRYVVLAGGAARYGRDERINKEVAWIDLLPKAVMHLQTEAGAQEYITAHDEYNAMLPEHLRDVLRVDATQISGGLTLEVLLRIGAVRAVNGVPVDRQQFRGSVRRALATTMVGIPPATIGAIQAGPEGFYYEFEPIDAAARICVPR